MKTKLWRIAALLGVLACAPHSQATRVVTVIVNYSVAATAVDNGPQDGIFDALAPINFGSINNNGFTSLRTVAEFKLPAMPQGSTILSADLEGSIQNFEGTRNIAVYGSAGNGTIQLADFSDGQQIAAFTTPPAGIAFTANVTSMVSALVAQGQTFAAFSVREEPANSSNFTLMSLAGNSPRLTIRISEPSPTGIPTLGTAALVLLIAAVPLVVMLARR